jgi:hypothetical protein
MSFYNSFCVVFPCLLTKRKKRSRTRRKSPNYCSVIPGVALHWCCHGSCRIDWICSQRKFRCIAEVRMQVNFSGIFPQIRSSLIVFQYFSSAEVDIPFRGCGVRSMCLTRLGGSLFLTIWRQVPSWTNFHWHTCIAQPQVLQRISCWSRI